MYAPRHATLPLTLLALLFAAGCARDEGGEGTNATAAPSLDTDRARISYMVGLDMAKTLAPVKDEVDLEIAIAAIRAVHAGTKPALDDAQANAVREQFSEILRKKQELAMRELARKNLAEADAFLKKNQQAEGVKATASGLQYRILRDGKGAKPGATDTVRVHYTSSTLAGTQIESTYASHHAASIALNRVFPGWAEAVQLMPIGGKYTFWIPPALAHGERGAGEKIEPNTLLVFEVELLEIAGKTGAAPDPAAPTIAAPHAHGAGG
ncbi:FKBP-type peptidyl-prolyl cis-trans isomerase N-terminal domain-containing protein [Lysobacter brunescens]|uniref:Peptidyl-prolyl cis-trans isomerase n=1 Tax=Lysobacter brunescens TaxID=262323 RepID=A0ABW2YA36_9GAMM